MPIAATGELIADADAEQRAVAAFNVITLEHAEAIAEGAEAAGSPVILQISENAVAYHRGRPRPLARAAAEVAAQAAVPVSLHLDHVQSAELLHRAADCGFSSAMFDAARLPYAENLAATRAAVVWAHERGLWLEAELGQVGGKNGEPALDAHAPGARTDPEEARSFVAATGVDALAVAVGTSHAMTSRDAVIDHALLGRLRQSVPVPLVLHGSSGASDEELSRAVAGGIRKVNIGTALNIALTAAIRERLARDDRSVDPRRYLADGRDAMAATVARMISALPSGRAHAA
ncbi:class II fructose-bisphosphate aldolase [Streptomyces sp. V2I9]|uniref:class II fructose-bisphosphate aldolase n=1 Tax=unclassified Streptomyces TaxID=2593676 RepID=UPI002784DDDF|nr:class II fructose-bisphosphate aldolase [Streptomyces sp. V2I9]MDQ0988652.1 fructose-bisphosphate aldolase class II [Streptomyces sp. V2I9]